MKEKHFIMENVEGKHSITPIKIFDHPEKLRMLTNQMSWKIFQELRSPSCPIDVAKKLGIHEQKVYYYISKFRREGLISEVRSEARHGTEVLPAERFRVRVPAQTGKGPRDKLSGSCKDAAP